MADDDSSAGDWAATPDFFGDGFDPAAMMRAAEEMMRSFSPATESFRVCPECSCIDETPRREFDGNRMNAWCGLCGYQYVKDWFVGERA